MHDPKTLIFSNSVFQLWHVDPCHKGDDDSCGYLTPRLTSDELKFADGLIDHPESAWRSTFARHPDASDESHLEESKYTIRYLFRAFKKETRPWWKHPKYHIWHWQINISFIEKLKRWMFSRCVVCGNGFSWGYCPSGNWDGDGPKWFRTELVWHGQCDPNRRLYAGRT